MMRIVSTSPELLSVCATIRMFWSADRPGR
jgi:hypothetical protein